MHRAKNSASTRSESRAHVPPLDESRRFRTLGRQQHLFLWGQSGSIRVTSPQTPFMSVAFCCFLWHRASAGRGQHLFRVFQTLPFRTTSCRPGRRASSPAIFLYFEAGWKVSGNRHFSKIFCPGKLDVAARRPLALELAVVTERRSEDGLEDQLTDRSIGIERNVARTKIDHGCVPLHQGLRDHNSGSYHPI